LFIPAIWLFVLFGVARGILNAHRDFIAPAFGAIFNHLSVIAILVVFGQAWTVYSLVVGVLIGAALQLAVLVPALVRRRMRYTLGLHLHSPGVRRLLALSSLITLGGVLQRISEFVNRALASGLSEGTIAALNYANRIFDLPTAIYVNSILTVSLPLIVAQLHGTNPQQAPLTFYHCLRFLLLGVAPMAVALVVLAQPVVAIIFQSGAFDQRATALTSEALMFYAPGLIAVAVIMLTGQVLYARGSARQVVGLAALGLGANIVLNVLLVASMQHRGLALATTLSFSAVAALNYRVLRRQLPGIPERSLGAFLVRLAVAVCGMALVMAWLLPIVTGRVDAGAFQERLVALGIIGVAGVLMYIMVLALLQVDEVLVLSRGIWQRFIVGDRKSRGASG
jgi:putative peptidoglycan lipid II flippase